MKPKRLFQVVFLAVLSLSCLSPDLGNRNASRTIACVDPLFQSLPFQHQLIDEIQNEALKKNALHFYQLLSRAELNSYSQTLAVRSLYGLGDPFASLSTLYSPPAVVNFNPGANPLGATGHLWGDIRSLGLPAASVAAAAALPGPGKLPSALDAGPAVVPQRNPGAVSLAGPGAAPQLGRFNPATVGIASGLSVAPPAMPIF